MAHEWFTNRPAGADGLVAIRRRAVPPDPAVVSGGSLSLANGLRGCVKICAPACTAMRRGGGRI